MKTHAGIEVQLHTVLSSQPRWKWVVRCTPQSIYSWCPLDRWVGWEPESLWTRWQREKSPL